VSGQPCSEFAHDEEADSIVGEDVIAETEEQQWSRRGRRFR
jgi:hypothetical protein